MPVAKVKGTFSVHYEEHGDGSRGAVLVGITDEGSELAEQLAALGVRVVAYDPRGEGRTADLGDASPSEPGLAQHAADLEGLLKAVKMMKPAVLATGVHARIAIAYAVRHIRDVRRVVLVAPDLTPADETRLGRVGPKALVLREIDAARIAESV